MTTKRMGSISNPITGEHIIIRYDDESYSWFAKFNHHEYTANTEPELRQALHQAFNIISEIDWMSVIELRENGPLTPCFNRIKLGIASDARVMEASWEDDGTEIPEELGDVLPGNLEHLPFTRKRSYGSIAYYLPYSEELWQKLGRWNDDLEAASNLFFEIFKTQEGLDSFLNL